jgi:hypothetical protein
MLGLAAVARLTGRRGRRTALLAVGAGASASVTTG